MKKQLVAFVLLLTFLITRVAHADISSSSSSTGLVPIPPGPDVIIAVVKGEPAPVNGQLFDNKTALRWGHYLEQAKLRLRVDVDTQRKVGDAEVAYQKRVLELERAQYASVTADLQKRLSLSLTENVSPPWYRNPWFTFTVGLVVMGASVALGAFALSAVR
jgi:hypothetical protein